MITAICSANLCTCKQNNKKYNPCFGINRETSHSFLRDTAAPVFNHHKKLFKGFLVGMCTLIPIGILNQPDTAPEVLPDLTVQDTNILYNNAEIFSQNIKNMYQKLGVQVEYNPANPASDTFQNGQWPKCYYLKNISYLNGASSLSATGLTSDSGCIKNIIEYDSAGKMISKKDTSSFYASYDGGIRYENSDGSKEEYRWNNKHNGIQLVITDTKEKEDTQIIKNENGEIVNYRLLKNDSLVSTGEKYNAKDWKLIFTDKLNLISETFSKSGTNSKLAALKKLKAVV